MKIVRAALIPALATLSLLISTSTFSQEKMRCGIDEHMEKLKKADPVMYKELMDANAKKTAEIKKIIGSNIQKAATTYIIPIVYHILHDDQLGKISEAKIVQSVKWLNEDFGGQSPYIGNIDPFFASLYADVGFEFRLAQLDPSGNCTNGINYYNDPVWADAPSSPDPKTWVQNQWSPQWDWKEYINIYLQPKLGYAYVSGYQVVLDSYQLNGFGVGSESKDNRSWIVHEVGHYYNLDHICF
ncbi:MAG: hypothetical protein IH948_08420 [Bacteroidetes bacterium]|nr:hypothetical protein [Bacteroidota bacterium]